MLSIKPIARGKDFKIHNSKNIILIKALSFRPFGLIPLIKTFQNNCNFKTRIKKYYRIIVSYISTSFANSLLGEAMDFLNAVSLMISSLDFIALHMPLNTFIWSLNQSSLSSISFLA